MTLKHCPRCQQTKPLNNFCFSKNNPDGLQYYCKECTRETGRLSYAKYHPNYKRRRKGLDLTQAKRREKLYRLGHRFQAREREKAWRNKNRLNIKIRSYKRRAFLTSSEGFATPEQIKSRLEYYGYKCAYCGGEFNQLDHVIPISKKGANWPANLRPCCRHCNASKGTRNWREWLQFQFV